jgi:hypothetical protein
MGNIEDGLKIGANTIRIEATSIGESLKKSPDLMSSISSRIPPFI